MHYYRKKQIIHLATFLVSGPGIVASGVASLLGYALFSHFSAEIIAATTAVAAGAILAMLTDTIIPEAFEQAHNSTLFDYCMRVSRRLCLE